MVGVGPPPHFINHATRRRQRPQFFRVKSLGGEEIIKILKSERYKNRITLSGDPRLERL